MAAARYPLFLATAAAHGVLGLGHTTKGLEQFKHPSLAQLPAILRRTVQTGWYEGSVFFVILGILNYKWAQTGLVDGADKALVTAITGLLFGAAGTYARAGDRTTGIVLAGVGALQVVAARAGLA